MNLCYYNLSLGQWYELSYDEWYLMTISGCFSVSPSDLYHEGYYAIYFGISDLTSSEWIVEYSKKHPIKVFSDFDAVDEYGETIIVAPPDDFLLSINYFSENTTSLKNTKIVSDEYGGQDIEIKAEDKIVNFIIDNSGSMLWNDNGGNRYDICKRMINRINDTYSGNASYNLFQFGGKRFTAILGGDNTESPLSTSALMYDADPFGDKNTSFYGYRIVRNSDHSPLTPNDGDIVYNGIANRFLDENLTTDSTYYYKLFTYDQYGNFSEGKDISIMVLDGSEPKGLSTVFSSFVIGTGTAYDDYTTYLWHLDDGYEYYAKAADGVAIDFAANNDLTIGGTNIEWISELETPSGYSALRFNGIDNYATAGSTSLGYYKDDFSVIFWVKPYSFASDSPVIYRSDRVSDIDWAIYLSSTNGYVSFIMPDGSTVFSNTGLSLTEWSQVAITIDSSGNGKIIINGVIDQTFSSVSPEVVSSKYVDIGYNEISSLYFFGEMTEISIHSTGRDYDYIYNLYGTLTSDNKDNTDRIVLTKFSIPTNYDYIGGNVRIVLNNQHKPYNENDGTIIYDESISDGDYYYTYRVDYVSSSSYYLRFFTQNSLGIYSNIFDSSYVQLVCPQPTTESLINIPEKNLPSITVSNVIENGTNIHIEWNAITSVLDARCIRIYTSETDYPIVSENCLDSRVIFEGNTSEVDFTYRNLTYSKDYYFTIVSVDQYGRTSEPYYFTATTNGEDSSANIPLGDSEGVGYQLISSTSIELIWPDVYSYRVTHAYFDEKILFFTKIIDEFGNTIDNDLFDISLDISASYSYVNNACADIFNNETSLNAPDSSSLYLYTLEDFIEGVSKGTISIVNSRSSLKNIEYIDIRLISKISTSSGDQSIEYKSYPLYIRFINPFSIELKNLYNSKITVRSPHNLSAMDKKPTIEKIEYDGRYLQSTSPYTERLIFSYKGLALDDNNILQYSVHEATKDLKNLSSPITDLGETDYISSIEPSDLTTSSQEIVDFSGVPTGVYNDTTYTDLKIIVPSSDRNALIYIKYSYGGYTIVKAFFVAFMSPLRIEAMPFVPICDGICKSEQFAVVYKIDPDYPSDLTKRTFLNNVKVKWLLQPEANGIIKPLTSTEDQPNISPGENSVYSTTQTNGVARNVFIGPARDVKIVSYDQKNGETYEIHALTASCFYNSLYASETFNIEFKPINVSIDGSPETYFLSEFDSYKNKLWTDGLSYQKMTISHDPNSSTTKYADCFVSCMSSLDKQIITLSPGQSVLVRVDDPDMEIIWGNVVEYTDPYSGQETLDISAASISHGSAFIQLSEGDYTYIYFRLNKSFDNSIIEYKNINNVCSDCIGLTSYPIYKNEINVYLSTVSIFSGVTNNTTIAMKSGGNMENGVPPTVIVPKDPLEIRLVDKRSGGVSINSLVVDGITYNQLVLDISFAGRMIQEDTLVYLTLTNKNEEIINVDNAYVSVKNYIDPLIDDANPRSYAIITVLPINKGKTYDAKIYATVSYDEIKNINRSKTICISISGDTEDTADDPSVTSQKSIFSDVVERCDLADFPNVTWQKVSSMNYPRGHFCCQISSYNEKIYVIGGINGKEITNIVEIYDIRTDTWSLGEPMPTPRMMAQSAMVYSPFNEGITVFGGIVYNNETNSFEVCRKVERYNIDADMWETLSDMPLIDIGTPDLISYGIAAGTIQTFVEPVYDVHFLQHQYSYAYILSGVKSISDDGTVLDFNDRILKYEYIYDNDVVDRWVYSDIVEDNERYKRIFPISFKEDDGFNYTPDIYVTGGAYQNKNSFDFVTNAYTITPSYLTDGTPIRAAESRFETLPYFGYKASIATDDYTSYIIGGSDNKFDNLSSCVRTNRAFTSPSLYDYTEMTPLSYSRNGLGSEVFYQFSPDFVYLFAIGGIESGKGNDFFSIYTNVYSYNLDLNGKQHIDIELSLYDNAGNIASGSINAIIKGYLQFYDQAISNDNIVSNDLLEYRVLFEDYNITFTNGKAFATLEPRSDDALLNISSNYQMQYGATTSRYKIVIQTTIDDSTYYGQNFIDTYNSSLSSSSSILGFDSLPCYSTSSNILIPITDNMQKSFELLSKPLKQQKSKSIVCVNKDPWITDITNFTLDGAVQASEAISLIDNMKSYDPFGGSPLCDAIVSCSNVLTTNSLYGIEKTVFAFTDKYPNSSVYTIDEAIKYAQSINSYKSVPVILLNLSIEDEYALIPSLSYESDNIYLNKIAQSTNGQSITLSSTDAINDVIYMLSGLAKGALGYGSAIVTIDLGSISSVRSAIVNYRLYSNTSGRWRISTSVNGYEYTDYSIRYDHDQYQSFSNIYARYIRFYLELFSGLSSSNEEPYENIPVSGVPAITGIEIGYAPQKTDYIFMNNQNTSSNEPNQIVISVDSNDKYNDQKYIIGGVDRGKWSHNWIDYYSDAQPEREV